MMTSLEQEEQGQHAEVQLISSRQDKYGLLLKASILSLLSVSNASIVVLTHYVRTRDGDRFISSSAVVTSEVVKVILCLLITLIESPRESWQTIYSVGNRKDWAKAALPACLYAVQNNLIFFALSHLNPVIFQITYQLKILTTALFSVTLLKKVLQPSHWFALLLLFTGVAVVQTNEGSNSVFAPTADQYKILAICAVLFACLLSGFASVYFEKMLKSSPTSVWVRNIQLGIPGGIFATITMLAKDWEEIISNGFFYGYDVLVWSLIFLQATGGLLVACVVKYTDNIIKTFAMAVAILLSLLASAFIFHQDHDISVLTGSGIVIYAVFLYSYSTETQE